MRSTFSSEIKEFVARCVNAYFGRLPSRLAFGFARPKVLAPQAYHPLDKSWPLTVDKKAQVGKIEADGRVRWKPVVENPKTFYPLISKFDGPPFLEAYFSYYRVLCLTVRTPQGPFRLAETPVQQPAFGVNALFLKWHPLCFQAKYLPFGFAEDGLSLLCCDLTHLDEDEDSPVVAVPTAPLFHLGRPPRREEVQAIALPLFPSVRTLFTQCVLNGPAWTANDSNPFDRVAVKDTHFRPFAWDPFLLPEIGPTQPIPRSRRQAALTPKEIDAHLERIATKVRWLRAADPAFLVPGMERHRHRMAPMLLPEELASFEVAENVTLPLAYARFLMKVGNGGFGPGFGLARLEKSAAGNFPGPPSWFGDQTHRVRRPFPHRQAWVAPRGQSDDPYEETPEDRERTHIKQVYGTVLLADVVDVKLQGRSVLLVVSGPERGHVWLEDLGRSNTIYPLLRRGPLSFLAWYEQALDHLLGAMDQSYENLLIHTKAEFVGLGDRAFRF